MDQKLETIIEVKPLETNRLWTETETATYLHISVELLQSDRAAKGRRRIPFIKLGRCVRYDPVDILAFKESCKVR